MTLSEGRARYGDVPSHVISSSRREWRGLYAESNVHVDCHLSSFVQQTTEVILAVRASGIVTCCVDGLVQKANATAGTIWLLGDKVSVDFLDASFASSAGAQLLHLHLDPKLFAPQALGDAAHESLTADLKSLGGCRDPLIEQIGLAIAAEMEAETSSGKLFVETLTSTLAARLLHSYTWSSRDRSPALSVPKGLDSQRLRRVLDFIEANLEGDLTIERMASTACLSRFYFARAFKASTGQPPHQYVSVRRLERAKSLILGADRSLADIAHSLNFSSHANFTRAFRRIVGQTPAQFRRSGPA